MAERSVTLEEHEWQAVMQLIVNAMINGNPVLLKLINQVQQQPGSSLRDPQRSSSEERGSEGEEGGSKSEHQEPRRRVGW